jgi:hypothetical protein
MYLFSESRRVRANFRSGMVIWNKYSILGMAWKDARRRLGSVLERVDGDGRRRTVGS